MELILAVGDMALAVFSKTYHRAVGYTESANGETKACTKQQLNEYLFNGNGFHGRNDIVKLSKQGLCSLKRRRLTVLEIPIINLRRSDDRPRFIMGIPIPIRRCIISE